MLKIIIAALLIGSGAHAEEACVVPPDLSLALVAAQEERRTLSVTKLVMAYYWWPEQCRRSGQAASLACHAGYGFKVHGLWPDGAGKTYPQFCRTPTALDMATVKANYCMTPSASLLQHEWVKHGTCNWPSPAAYFGDAARVAGGIRLPDAAALPASGLTAGKLRDAVVAANPALPRASLFVGTSNKQWLTELRVCLTVEYAPVACEDGDIGASDMVPMRVRARSDDLAVVKP